MKHQTKVFFTGIIIFLVGIQNLTSQEENLIDAEYIKTVVLKSATSNSFAPIFRVGEAFSLSFDDIEADEKDYYYEIVHVDYNWQKSSIADNEYLVGFSKDRIRNYENSFNTLQFFTHYQVSFPNEKTQIIQSGNYILKVLNDYDEVVLIRRFVLVNPKVEVGVTVQRTRSIDQINTHQNVQFVVNYQNFNINNPSEEIKIAILQNNNWANAKTNLKPQYIRANQLVYKYDKETNFLAGNEYLNFDTKIIRNTSLNIRNVYLGDDIFYTHLFVDEERSSKPYTYYPDVNGNFVIRNLEGENASLDADYSWVHFYLKPTNLSQNKEVFVYGGFNNWQFSDVNKMKYNATTGLYELPILLKQGFYNYRYATIDSDKKINEVEIDGSFFQTENEYSVIVYWSKIGGRFDEVIGYGTVISDMLKQ